MADYANELATNKLACVFGHASYLINVGAPVSGNRGKSNKSLSLEVNLADDLGLPFLVLHPGAHLGAGEESGLRQIVAGLHKVFEATKNSPVRIALENTEGQGTCLGHKVEHLAVIFDRVQRLERLGVCLDTAHFFKAGFDLPESRGWKATISQVDSLLGLKEIPAFYLNDSITDLGSRVDRHAGIGLGKIGAEAFRHIVDDGRFCDSPGCLETPSLRTCTRTWRTWRFSGRS